MFGPSSASAPAGPVLHSFDPVRDPAYPYRGLKAPQAPPCCFSSIPGEAHVHSLTFARLQSCTLLCRSSLLWDMNTRPRPLTLLHLVTEPCSLEPPSPHHPAPHTASHPPDAVLFLQALLHQSDEQHGGYHLKER